MTTLVTGGTGFAGINIVRALALAGENVIALDQRPAEADCQRFLEGLKDWVTFEVGDVLDLNGLVSLARKHQVGRFVHAAAITPSGDVERMAPRHVVNVNLMGTVNMLETARTVSAERFVFTSSSGVYGAPKDRKGLVGENSPLELDGLYSICKYSSELLLKRYKTLFGLSTVAGRMCAIYGPMERVTASRGQPSVIYKLVSMLLNKQIVTARGREFVRDYTHVEDASSIWARLTLADELNYDVFNVSAGVAYPLGDVLETLYYVEPAFQYRWAGPGEDVDIEITSEGERGALDISRVVTEFGFSPKYGLLRGLENYVEWAREHAGLFSAST